MSSPSPASSIQDGGAATAPRVGDVRGMTEEAFDSGLNGADALYEDYSPCKPLT